MCLRDITTAQYMAQDLGVASAWRGFLTNCLFQRVTACGRCCCINELIGRGRPPGARQARLRNFMNGPLDASLHRVVMAPDLHGVAVGRRIAPEGVCREGSISEHEPGSLT